MKRGFVLKNLRWLAAGAFLVASVHCSSSDNDTTDASNLPDRYVGIATSESVAGSASLTLTRSDAAMRSEPWLSVRSAHAQSADYMVTFELLGQTATGDLADGTFTAVGEGTAGSISCEGDIDEEGSVSGTCTSTEMGGITFFLTPSDARVRTFCGATSTGIPVALVALSQDEVFGSAGGETITMESRAGELSWALDGVSYEGTVDALVVEVASDNWTIGSCPFEPGGAGGAGTSGGGDAGAGGAGASGGDDAGATGSAGGVTTGATTSGGGAMAGASGSSTTGTGGAATTGGGAPTGGSGGATTTGGSAPTGGGGTGNVSGACTTGVDAPLAAIPVPGDLVISEIMMAPLSGLGKFVEVANVSGQALDLAGCNLETVGTVALASVCQSTVVEAGAEAALAGLSTDPGFAADGRWQGSVYLPEDSFTLTISCPDGSGGFQMIDDAVYDLAGFVNDGAFYPNGASLSLETLDASANDSALAWCPGLSAYTNAAGTEVLGFGTPGQPNDPCPVIECRTVAGPYTGVLGEPFSPTGYLRILGYTNTTLSGNEPVPHPLLWGELRVGTDPNPESWSAIGGLSPTATWAAPDATFDTYEATATYPSPVDVERSLAFAFTIDGKNFKLCDADGGTFEVANATKFTTTL